MDWYIECGGVYKINNENIFGRKIYIEPEKLKETMDKKFKNIDIYSTVFLYNNKDQNQSDLIGPLYVDLDGDIIDGKSYDKVKQDALLAISYLETHLKVPKDYIRIYFSGNKGFHLIIPFNVFGITPCKDLNDKYKAIAIILKENTINKSVDTRIYDKKRLIRLPHSINGKTGLFKVPISENDLRNFGYEDMVEYSREDKSIEYEKTETIEEARQAFDILTAIKPKVKKDISNKAFINTKYEIPVCIKRIYAVGAEKGFRNNTLMILASALLQKGKELENVIDAMIEWNESKNDPSLEQNEVEATVRSAYRNLVDGRRYGCTSIKELGLCVGENCKLYK
jgi:DNA-binding HxlR family transcriptional regulator